MSLDTSSAESEVSGLRQLAGLSLGALGVVYGDIGTSPLYAMRECFHGPHAVPPTPSNVLGVLSLIFWSLILVISIKYLIFVLRADNRGEGGILSLMALMRSGRSRHWLLIVLGLFGAALLYGDGMITPAISVLSAVEGLEIGAPFFHPYVVPITVAILVGLFLLQRRGTEGLARLFGPIMMLWFLVLAGLGIYWIVLDPSIFAAVDPAYAVRFFADNGAMGFLVLGSVFLVATGGEVLYADMGYFGRYPIRAAWFTLVLPSLLLNYFGQGALLLHSPGSAEHLFFRLAPLAPVAPWGLYPLVGLATAATVIASQAVISGAFSLTRQAAQLGYIPRVAIVHTSQEEIGQIYIPAVNRVLMVATIGLVLGFRESTRLAGAYGVAVSGTMVITTILAYVVARDLWGWGRLSAGLLMSGFLVLDLSFFAANLVKVPHGGWFPLVAATLIYLLMATWKQGRRLLVQRLQEGALPIEDFLRSLRPGSPPRVPGTAVFLTTHPQGTPATLLHNLKHNKVLHERVVLLTVVTLEVPVVLREERIAIKPIEPAESGFYRMTAFYGYMQDPHAPEVMELAQRKGLDLDPMTTTFFLSRETIIASRLPGMAVWRKRLFVVMARNAVRFTDFFRIPINRVIELGMQVRL